MPLSESLLPYRRKWDAHILRVDDAISRAEAISSGSDIELAEHHINNIERAYQKYMDAWETFVDKLLEEKCSESEFKALNDRVTNDKWKTVGKLTTLKINVKKQENLPKPKYEVPTVKVAEFDGKFEAWTQFWEAYNNVIHSNPVLTKTIQFHHLKGALTGEASNLIQGFSITDDNYDAAITLLKEKYDDPKRTKRLLIRQLIHMKSPRYCWREIHAFHEEFTKLKRSLESLVSFTSDSWLCEELLIEKLPAEAKEYLFNKYDTPYLSLDQLTKGLVKLIGILEVHPSNLNKEVSKEKVSSNKNSKAHSEGDEVVQGAKSRAVWQAPTKNVSCIICEEAHFMNSCPTYVTADQKVKHLIKRRLCYRCAQPYSKEHQCMMTCSKCHGRHKTVLCSIQPRRSTNLSNQTNQPKGNEPTGVNVKQVQNKHGGVALPTAQLTIGHRDKNLRCRGFFDCGSQISFVHPDVLAKLNIKYDPKIYLEVAPFGKEVEMIEGQYSKLKLGLGKRKFLLNFFATEKVRMRAHAPGLEKTREMLSGYKLADPEVSDQIDDVDIVVGADYFGKLIGRCKLLKGVNVFSSPGGYLIFGKLPYGSRGGEGPRVLNSIQMKKICVGTRETEFTPTEISLPKLWQLDTIGISADQVCKEENKILREFAETIVKTEDRYEVKFPMSKDPSILPSNYGMAKFQLNSLLVKLRKDTNMMNCYHSIIKEYDAFGFIEQVTGSIKGHYLPHHPVHKDSTTTPIRIVFNASAAKRGETSLNDVLETGPTLTEKLLDSLVSFKQGKYALCADIRKAFLQVGLQESERDFVRFLWVDDPSKTSPKFITYRFRSVPFGTTSSPFLLQATLYRHLSLSEMPWKAKLLHSFYVDNFSITTDMESDLFEIYQQTTECLADANMPLQEWNSNNVSFNQWKNDPERKETLSVLGIRWNTKTDVLAIKNVVHPQFTQLTKRSALAYVSELYDPLGLVSPIGIRGRLFMRELWLLKKDWDERLDDQWVTRLNKLTQCYSSIAQIEFPRMSCALDESIELHIFCDASSDAYGAVAYTVNSDNSQIIMSKARVSPIKGKTIPQLELTAILIGCRLANYLLSNLQCQVTNTYVWTDNLPCITWIKNNKSNIVYVKNRVGEILDLQETTGLYLNHVRTKENPADMLSRGMTVKNLSKGTLWKQGPDWLRNKAEWPKITQNFPTPVVGELITERVEVKVPEPIFPPEQYSSYTKLVNVTKYVIKFLQIKFPGVFSHVTPEKYWLCHEQSVHFPIAKRCILTGMREKQYHNSLQFIKDLNLYIDEQGLLRAKGRYGRKRERVELNNVVLLPPKGYVSRLFVNWIHANNFHSGVNHTLSKLREEFWMPHGRPVVKKCIRECFVCKITKGLTFRYPSPASLPDCRISYKRPFEVSGVDFAGPISLKNRDGTLCKYYICLFTCCATRAVHLECCPSLSAEAFINCLRRFAARCSLPSRIISDNGTNFVATAKFLNSLHVHVDVSHYLETNKIVWTFNTPRAPWQGGLFERLIKVVKDCLYKALFKREINHDELVTILTETESIINNRPLTYVSNTSTEEDILCPAKLLYGRTINIFPSILDVDTYVELTSNVDVLLGHYKKVADVVNKFYRIWSTQYLASLREKHYNSYPNAVLSPEIGDVVYVKDDHDPAHYPLGVVRELTPNFDNKVREVKVEVKGELMRKTVDRLIPLELHTSPNSVVNDVLENESSSVSQISQSSSRPKRKAADRCTQERRKLIDEGHLV